MRQLALPFAVATGFAASDFVPGPGSEVARTWLARTAEWPAGRLALYGEAGSGKSHLLHIWAEREGARIITGSRLAGEPAAGAPAVVSAIAIDDADCAGDEHAFLHLLNFAAESRVPVLLAGRAPPHDWPVRLPDLASRLRAIQAITFDTPADSELAAIFARFLSIHQLIVGAELQNFLLARLPRRPAALAQAAALLDRMALAEGRRVGRAMASVVLARLGTEREEQLGDASSPDIDPVLL